MKTLVPVVLIVGALIGWIGPDFRTPAEFVGGSQSARPDDSQLQLAAKPQWYGGEMVLEKAGDGHFYALVQVDGRDYRMLVDTGASAIALTGEDARNIGLDWDPNRLVPVARGANGTIMGVQVALKEVAIGDFIARNVDAIIVPEGLPVSLLGQSFLSHVNNVQINGDKMTLAN